MKKTISLLIVVILVGVGIYFFTRNMPERLVTPPAETATTVPPVVETTTEAQSGVMLAIGKSVEGRDITAYTYGTGATELLFIGGIHGGYEWNTALVAYQLMDYLSANSSAVPANVKVTVIPVLNPDGLFKVTGTAGRFAAADVNPSQTIQVTGRFNGHTVDLNRNFDCDWQATGTWQNKAVSGGTKAFSEPESQAIKTYVEAHKPTAVVTFYSAAGGVYSSNCHNGVSVETKAITSTYAKGSGYPAFENFDFYETTGDISNWFAKNGIPAISVLLTNHTDTEWTKNQAGVEAMLKYYSK
ncbi:MAG: M14 family metallopeptidase [bacterium]|nr:M14 family metallopeptidase [bacterium]